MTASDFSTMPGNRRGDIDGRRVRRAVGRRQARQGLARLHDLAGIGQHLGDLVALRVRPHRHLFARNHHAGDRNGIGEAASLRPHHGHRRASVGVRLVLVRGLRRQGRQKHRHGQGRLEGSC